MRSLVSKIEKSPLLARVLPLAVFLVILFSQSWFGEAGRYWNYLARTLVGAWLVWLVRPYVAELKWALSWEAVATGVAVFVVWVGLDDYYPKYSKPGTPWNPNTQFGAGSGLAWFFISVRILGSSLVVPPIEEMFYRSFLYRYIAKQDFMSVPLAAFTWMPFLVTSAVFGLPHFQWLPGFLCGMAYQGLVCRKNRLGDAITAHAITNLLLGLWVVYKGAWQFW